MEDKQTKLDQVKGFIKNLENKDFTLYFFTLDTKGNPTAGIANIYEHVKVLNGLGYKAVILHEKNDYKLHADEAGMGIAEWLGAEYAALPHKAIEGQNLNIRPTDFIVIPEIFSTIMDQVKSFPCRKIVFCQSYDYLLELLPIGKRWDLDYGFSHVITTSERQAAYVRQLFKYSKTYITPVSIPEYFKPSVTPKVPIVSIVTRNPGDAVKIAKAFYLQYPIYKWITFKELRGLSREQFAEDLGKSCLAVWVDETAGFGTFPLEAFECGTPIIGRIPNMVPDWMETLDENGNAVIKNNGVWTNTSINIPELIATYLKVWFEDSVPTELLNVMKESAGKYTPAAQAAAIENVFAQLVAERIAELSKLIENEETATA
jgi:hypothetical protein